MLGGGCFVFLEGRKEKVELWFVVAHVIGRNKQCLGSFFFFFFLLFIFLLFFLFFFFFLGF